MAARKYLKLLCLTVAGIAPVSLPAWAAFDPPVNVSPNNQNAFDPQVAFDGDGDALIVWQETILSGAESSLIRLRTRTAGGTLSGIKNLTPAGKDVFQPQIAVSEDGDAAISWLLGDGAGNLRVQARTRAADGTYGETKTLSSAGKDALFHNVVVGPDGDALIIWVIKINDDDFRLQGRTLSAEGEASAVFNISPVGSILTPDLAMDQEGDAVVVWYDTGAIKARRYSAAGVMGQIKAIDNIGLYPKVGVDADGDAFIVWDALIPNAIEGRAFSRNGALSDIQTFTAAGSNADTPDVGMDAAGNALVTWTNYGTGSASGTARIQLRNRTVGGGLGGIKNLSSSGELSENPRIAVAANGDAVVAWEREGSSTQDIQIQARARSAAGTLGSLETLSADNMEARYHQAAIDPDGDALVVWSLQTTSGLRLQASGGP